MRTFKNISTKERTESEQTLLLRQNHYLFLFVCFSRLSMANVLDQKKKYARLKNKTKFLCKEKQSKNRLKKQLHSWFPQKKKNACSRFCGFCQHTTLKEKEVAETSFFF